MRELISFQVPGRRTAASKILIASPIKKGSTPRASALPSDMMCDHHQARNSEGVDDEVAQRHHADGRQHATVSAPLSEPSDQPGRRNEAHNVADRGERPATLMVRKPWHSSDPG